MNEYKANPITVDKLLSTRLVDTMPLVAGALVSSHGCADVGGFEGSFHDYIMAFGREDLKFFLAGTNVSETALTKWLEFTSKYTQLWMEDSQHRQATDKAWGELHREVSSWSVFQLKTLRKIIEHTLDYYDIA